MLICFSHVWLFVTLWSPLGSSVHGILQARISEWVAVSFSRRSSKPRDQTHVSSVSCTGKWILYHWATWELLFQPMEAYLPVSYLFCLFILLVRFSWQEYCRGLPFPSPVDHVLSELFTMTRPSWVALHSMVHSFTELHRPLQHEGCDPWSGDGHD